MSRRLRVEELERLQSTKKDFLEQDKLKLRRERIYAPILWRTTVNNFKVIDLKEKYFEETVQMLMDYYVTEEVIYRCAEIKDDEVSMKSFHDKVYFLLKDTCSLCVIEETQPPPSSNTDIPTPPPIHELAGVLVLRSVHKVDFGKVFTPIIMCEGEAQKNCITILSTLHRRVDIYKEMNCESYLRYYFLCIKPQFRSKGLGYKLMVSGLDTARLLHINVVMGIFSSRSLQKLAKKIGMETLSEINYVEWRDRNGELIFDDPGAGNYTCSLMACHIPEESIPEPKPPVVKIEVPIKQPKMTRIEKREAVLKQAQKAAKI